MTKEEDPRADPNEDRYLPFQQTLVVPDSFTVLNEIQTAMWLMKFDKGAACHVWSNVACYRMWNKNSNEEFVAVDIQSNLSKTVEQIHEEYYRKTQDGLVHRERRTLYPSGKTLTLDFEFRPVDLVHKVDGRREKAMLVIGNRVDIENEYRDDHRKQALRHSEMLRHSDTMAALFHVEGHVLETNHSFERYYYRLHERTGTRASSAVAGKDEMSLKVLLDTYIWKNKAEMEEHLQRIQKLRIGDKEIRLEVEKKTSIDGVQWTLLHVLPTTDPFSADPAILVNETNISVLKEYQQELVEAQKSQEQFFAAISHELRTPLNGIIGLSDSLLMDKNCPPTVGKTLGVIKSSGQRLLGLVNDILDAASSKRDTLVIKQELLELKDTADNVCDVVSSLLRKGVKLENKIDGSLPPIIGDANRINQILTNLLSNAIKFTHKGTITLQAKVVQDAGKRELLVEVTDQGIGIPESKQAEIWGAFKQVDMSTTRKYGGTGLGLSLVRTLVQAHQGKVGVRSRHGVENSGSTFSFTLPVPEEQTTNNFGKSVDMPVTASASITGVRKSSSKDQLQSLGGSRDSPSGTRTPSPKPPRVRDPEGREFWDHIFGEQNQASWNSLSRALINEGYVQEDQHGELLQLKKQMDINEDDVITINEWNIFCGRRGLKKAVKDSIKPKNPTASDSQTQQIENMMAEMMKMAQKAQEAQKVQADERDQASDPAKDRELEDLRKRVSAVEDLEQLNEVLRNQIQVLRHELEDSKKETGPLGATIKGVKHHSEMNDGIFEILSVDDNIVNHMVVENSLLPRGYVVSKCMDGLEALDFIENRGFLPDLILLDCMMPQMNGYEFCQKLRDQYPQNSLPVIMVSAKDKEEDIVQGLEVGCNDYLSKPYGVMELNARIDTQLRLKYLWKLEIQRLLSERAAALQLPAIAEEKMRSGDDIMLELHSNVTVLILEVVDMMRFVEELTMDEFARFYNEIYSAFDEIVVRSGATRIIDDSYMIVLGSHNTEPTDPRVQAEQMLQIARDLVAATAGITIKKQQEEVSPKVRIGVARGPVYSALVGVKLTYFTYFGEAVREACEAGTRGYHNCIHVTQGVYDVAQGQDLLPFGKFKRLSHNPAAGRGSKAAEGVQTYILKEGDFLEGLAMVQGISPRNAQMPKPSLLDVTKQDQTLSARTYLRAFLRMTASDESARGSPGEGEELELCSQCQARVSEVQNLKEELEVLREKNATLTVNQSKNASDAGHISRKLSGDARTEEMPRTASVDNLLATTSALKGEIEILSVDDDPVNQMVMENLLGPEGYKVTSCMDGMEALEYISEASALPDLILLDVMMPGMSGHEVCEELRKKYSYNALPVIMVSAKSSQDNIVEGLAAGCNDYVAKPFDRMELLARVGTQLKLRDAHLKEVEHQKNAKLLQSMLPPHVISKLQGAHSSMIVEEHKEVSVLFSDIVGYTALAATLPTMELIKMLNMMFSKFDALCDKHGVYKVETIGDAYMIVAGHEGNSKQHAKCLVDMALDMLEAVKEIEYPRNPGRHMQIRVGIHSGPAFSGVVGTKMPRYCFFGDTINTASRMESTGFAMTIHMSDVTMRLLDGAYEFISLGNREIKGKGMMETFLLKHEQCAYQTALNRFAQVADPEQLKRLRSMQASFADLNKSIKEAPPRTDSEEVLETIRSTNQSPVHASSRRSSKEPGFRSPSNRRLSEEDQKNLAEVQKLMVEGVLSNNVRTMSSPPRGSLNSPPTTDMPPMTLTVEVEHCKNCAKNAKRESQALEREMEVTKNLEQLRGKYGTLLVKYEESVNKLALQTPQTPAITGPPGVSGVGMSGGGGPPQSQQPAISQGYSVAPIPQAAESPMDAILLNNLLERDAMNQKLVQDLLQRDRLHVTLIQDINRSRTQGSLLNSQNSAPTPSSTLITPQVASITPTQI